MAALLELCCGTVRQATLLELIDVAGAAGFDAITTHPHSYREAGVADAEIRARLRDAGVRVTNLDGFGHGLPGMPKGDAIEPYRSFMGRDVSYAFETPEDEFYRTAEAIGGESINLVHFGGDPATSFAAIVEAVGGICERAGRHGLRVVIEFLPDTGVPTIARAAELVTQVGAANLGIMLDTRHLARTGGTVEDVARHAVMLGGLQFSDVLWRCIGDPNRLLPGAGELPLGETLRLALQAHPELPVGIEVFNDGLMRLPPAEAADAAATSMVALLAHAAEVRPGG